MSPSLQPKGQASASRVDTPTRGIPAAKQMPFAVASPMRMPVKDPGPTEQTMRWISRTGREISSRSRSTSGTRVGECCSPRRRVSATRASPFTAAMASTSVAVSIARARVGTLIPEAPDLDVPPAVIGEAQVDLQGASRAGVKLPEVSLDLLPPFDQAHTLAPEEVVQAEVVDLVAALDPVEVHVVQGQAPLVLGDDGVGGADHLLCHAEAAGDSLREGGLARAQRADQQHDAARREPAGDRGACRLRLGGRHRMVAVDAGRQRDPSG